MGAVNFYLKKKEPNTGKCLVYLKYKYSGNVLVYSSGQTIVPGNWNKNKQRVKSNKETTKDGQHSINDLLENLKLVCEKAYKDELKNGIPQPSQLKQYLDNFLNQNAGKQKDSPTLFKLIDRFVSGEIKSNGKDKSKGTLQNYHAIKKHLMQFEKDMKYKVDFESINLEFFYKYTDFLRKKLSLSANTVAKDIRILKVFMAEAIDLGYTNNLQFKNKKFSVVSEETDAVCLTDKEIMRLYYLDLSGNKKLDQVRDLFVFGCYVGLRYSDFSNIQKDNVVNIEGEYFIKIITAKTGEQVTIPCNPIVLKIFEKYGHNTNRLPKSISNQKFNDYVKEICKLAGLTETGRLATNPEMELHECVSSHTGRRSMATNLYLEGFPVYHLMKITGHRTEKSLMVYLKVSKLDSAKRLNEHIKKMWSAKILKVAG